MFIIINTYTYERDKTKFTLHPSLQTGLVTVTSNDFMINVDSYSVGHSSAFVPPGSVRVAASSNNEDLIVAAYTSPDGSVVIVAHALYWEGSKEVAFEVNGQRYLVNVDSEASVTIIIDN